ncbi:MAG: radical SAM protein [Promethearchaeota archaeon]
MKTFLKNNLIKENQNYDVRLVWQPYYNCNLNCAYCIVKDLRKTTKISKINISALMKFLNETNKIFNIDISGGEPFLFPNLIESCIEITKNHYITISTNLITGKIKEFSEKIDPKRVIIIYASLHTKELENLDLLDEFINNFHLFKERGFNISVYEVAYPPILDEIDKYKEFLQREGIKLNFKPYIGEYKGKRYPDSYTGQEFKIFNFKKKYEIGLFQRGNICNAGYNVFFINVKGNITYCFKIDKLMGKIYHNIKFRNKLIRCPVKFCPCCFNLMDLNLYKKAINETNSKVMNSIFLQKYMIKEFLVKVANKYFTHNSINQIIKFIANYYQKLF